MKVALFGATSKTGRYVAAELARRGHLVTAIGRNADRLAILPDMARRVVADLTRPETLPLAIAGADVIASLAHAARAPDLLRAVPNDGRRLVLTGSLRRHTRLRDPAADAVREAESLFVSSARPGVMLHPSMIFGAPDDRNVNRVLAYCARFPRGAPVPFPLPGGGQATVQPVFVDDMVAAFVAAIERPDADGPPIAVAGPEPMTYRSFVTACAAALGRKTLIIPMPMAILASAVTVATMLALPVPVNAAEFARSTENKAFDIGPLRTRLGIVPRPFVEGLRLKLERGWGPPGVR